MTEPTQTFCPIGEDDCPIYGEVAALKKDIEHLKALVKTDHLTGLHNKQHLFSALDTELERTNRTGQPTTIMLIDADHFKAVNDTHGHLIGDQVLKNLSSLIRNGIRKIDIPCRFGGEEFCVILPSTPSFIGAQVAERIRMIIECNPVQIDEITDLTVTVSIGVATYKNNAKLSRDAFLSLCDEQLYRAKKMGRNCVASLEQDKALQPTVSSEEKDALFSNKPL